MKGDDYMNKILCARLKEGRQKLNLTQQQMAEKLKITQSAYCFYENGRNEPDLNIMGIIAEIYGTSIDYLVGRY